MACDLPAVQLVMVHTNLGPTGIYAQSGIHSHVRQFVAELGIVSAFTEAFSDTELIVQIANLEIRGQTRAGLLAAQ